MKTNEVILQMHPLSCHLALLLRRAPPGSLGSVAGWGLWGERWLSLDVSPRAFFWFDQGLKPGNSFCFPVLLDDSFCFLSLFFFTTGRLERRWLTSKFCWTCQLIDLCVLFFKLWISFELCVHLTWHNCIWYLFHQSKHKAIVHLSSFPTWSHSTHRRIQAWGPTPPTPSSGGGPAPPSSCRARSAPRRAAHAHAHLHVQPGCHPVEAGEAGWGGAEGLCGGRWPYRTFHQGPIFVCPRPEAWIFSCQFPNIAGLPFLGVIHRWDLHPHFIVVIGKMNTWQNCQIFPVNSCKWGL